MNKILKDPGTWEKKRRQKEKPSEKSSSERTQIQK